VLRGWPTRGEVARGVERVLWAGQVLAAAGLLAEERVTRTVAGLDAALSVRAGAGPSRLDRALRQMDGPPAGAAPPARAAQPMRVTPVGAALRVTGGRAPAELHLMTLVGTPADAVITAAMRMHWPADGSSADLEIAGAGPEHLPYGQLWMADDQGTRYRITLAGEGGTAIWRGTLQLTPAPPPGARWLDLIADGTRRLIRLDLTARAPAGRATTGRDPAVPPGERLLARQADRILADAGSTASRAASVDPRLGEMITALTGAGALAPDSPLPGHLAALCLRLGADPSGGFGITAPPAADIPGPWASVLAGLGTAPADPAPDWFAPAGAVLPDVDGTRFAVAGLSHAGGDSDLHVVTSGGPEPAWDPGYSLWVRPDAGSWHVAWQTERSERGPGQTQRLLRLTPPLSGRPHAVEVVVTGPTTRVRAVLPVQKDPAMADT
jgi:hypothetical protein